jgi:hypothetical protein
MFDLDALADDCAADGVWEFSLLRAAAEDHRRRRLAPQPARHQIGLQPAAAKPLIWSAVACHRSGVGGDGR